MRLQQRFTLNGNDATFLMSLAVFIFSQLLIHRDQNHDFMFDSAKVER